MARCIMCNSQFQDVFMPDKTVPSKDVCPPSYVFAGRLGVSDKEQLATPAEAKDYKESDANNLEMFKASQQSIMVPLKIETPFYEKCELWDKKELKEKEWKRKLNIFDGYVGGKGQGGKEGATFLVDKVVPGTINSFGYNLCCNPIEDSQKQSLCEVCTSCDPFSQDTVLTFKDSRAEGSHHLDKTSLYKGDCCRGKFGRSTRNIDAVSLNIDASIGPEAWKQFGGYKETLSLCCQRVPRIYLEK